MNFRNIFPFRCYAEIKTFYFYIDSTTNDLISHLSLRWTHGDIEIKSAEENISQILEDLKNNEGYKLLLMIKRD